MKITSFSDCFENLSQLHSGLL